MPPPIGSKDPMLILCSYLSFIQKAYFEVNIQNIRLYLRESRAENGTPAINIFKYSNFLIIMLRAIITACNWNKNNLRYFKICFNLYCVHTQNSKHTFQMVKSNRFRPVRSSGPIGQFWLYRSFITPDNGWRGRNRLPSNIIDVLFSILCVDTL